MLTIKLKQTIKNVLPNGLRESIQTAIGMLNKIPEFRMYQDKVRAKHGIEIGGPSTVFRTILPLYQVVKELDGVNFTEATIWEGPIQKGRNFNFIGTRKGFQFICDATDLSPIAANTYDFVLSSHCLEHVANPLKALGEWRRVLRKNGTLVLVLPNKQANFDHNRPTTTFQHLQDDYNLNIGEDDLSHLEEILALHDLAMDPPAGTAEQFRIRSLDNLSNRTLHHHVFDMPLIEKMLNAAGFAAANTHVDTNNFFCLGVKMD